MCIKLCFVNNLNNIVVIGRKSKLTDCAMAFW